MPKDKSLSEVLTPGSKPEVEKVTITKDDVGTIDAASLLKPEHRCGVDHVPSDKVPDLGVGVNRLPTNLDPDGGEALKEINEGEQTCGGGIGINERERFTPPTGREGGDVDIEVPGPDPTTLDVGKMMEDHANTEIVRIAKEFLKDDDKMTDYADQLRELTGVCATDTDRIIEVPGAGHRVHVKYLNARSISVMPV